MKVFAVLLLGICCLFGSTEASKCDSFDACNARYDPICGKNKNQFGRTFSNACDLNIWNCKNPNNQFKFDYQGECKCPESCLAIHEPICVKDARGNLSTVGNSCELAILNCRQELYTFVREGECDEIICPDACPTVYDPVCGKNSKGTVKTFSNGCSMHQHNCQNKDDYKQLYEGECAAIAECPENCIAVYKPICAKNSKGNMKTFSNACVLIQHNCLHKDDYEEQYKGECEDNTKCPENCIELYDPICARNSKGNTETFSNGCFLIRHNCQNKEDYKEQYKGECKECPENCYTLHQPICAKNSNGNTETFSNRCFMGQYNCQNKDDYVEQYEGECIEKCPENCITLYEPVCAKNSKGNMKTFSNLCFMGQYNCQNNDDYKEQHKGECEKKCPESCITLHQPICAKNSKGNTETFSNRCFMGLHNCHNNDDFVEQYEGNCKDQEKCPENCIALYQPICARNSKGVMETFSNGCIMKQHNCQNNDDFKKHDDGKCFRFSKL